MNELGLIVCANVFGILVIMYQNGQAAKTVKDSLDQFQKMCDLRHKEIDRHLQNGDNHNGK